MVSGALLHRGRATTGVSVSTLAASSAVVGVVARVSAAWMHPWAKAETVVWAVPLICFRHLLVERSQSGRYQVPESFLLVAVVAAQARATGLERVVLAGVRLDLQGW